MLRAVAAIFTDSLRLTATSPVACILSKLVSKFFSCTTKLTHTLLLDKPCTYISVR